MRVVIVSQQLVSEQDFVNSWYTQHQWLTRNSENWKVQWFELWDLKDADGRLYVPERFVCAPQRESEEARDDARCRSELLDRKALGTVRLSLAASVMFNIWNETTIKELMDALSNMYEKPSASNKVYLMKKLFNIRMADNGTVTEHLNEFNTITSQLEYAGIVFDDEVRLYHFCQVCRITEIIWWWLLVTPLDLKSWNSMMSLDSFLDKNHDENFWVNHPDLPCTLRTREEVAQRQQ